MKIDKSQTTNTKSNYFHIKNTNFQADFYSLDPDPHLDGIRMEAEIKRKKPPKISLFQVVMDLG